MVRRSALEAEIADTNREIKNLEDQIVFKRTYINALNKKIRELDEIERMG